MQPSDPRRLAALDRAVARYARTIRQGTSPCRVDGNPETQTDNYRRAQERLELRSEQVRQVLASIGVPAAHFVPYRAFALHLDAIIRRYSAETLRALIRAALGRWTAFGLDPEVLNAVARHVFGL